MEKIWQPFWHQQAHTLQAALEQAESTYRQQQRRPAEYRWQQLLAEGTPIEPPPGETGPDEAAGDGVEEIKYTVEEQIHFQAHLLEAVEQAIILTDMAGRIGCWNRFAEIIYGWPPGQGERPPFGRT